MRSIVSIQVFLLFFFIVATLFAAGCSCGGDCPDCKNRIIFPEDDDDASNEADDDTGDDDTNDDDDTTTAVHDLIFIGTDDVYDKPVLNLWNGQNWVDQTLPDFVTEKPNKLPFLDIALTGPDHGFAVTGKIFELDAQGTWTLISPEKPPAPVWDISRVSATSPDWAVFAGSIFSVEGDQQPLILMRNAGVWTEHILPIHGLHKNLDVTTAPGEKAWVCGTWQDENKSEICFLMKYVNGNWSEMTLPQDLHAFGLKALEIDQEVHLFVRGNGNYDYFNGVWNEIGPDEKDTDSLDMDANADLIALIADKAVYLNDGSDWTRTFIHLPYKEYHFLKVEVVASDDAYIIGMKRGDSLDSVPLMMHFDGSVWTEMDLTGTVLETGEIGHLEFADKNHAWFSATLDEEEYLIEYSNQLFQPPYQPMAPHTFTITDASLGLNGAFLAILFNEENPVLLENTGDGWNLVHLPSDTGATKAIASSLLGTFAVTGELFKRSSEDWIKQEIPGFGDNLSLQDIIANDYRAAATGNIYTSEGSESGSESILIVNDGNGWYQAAFPQALATGRFNISSITLIDSNIWMTGYRINDEANQRFLARYDAQNQTDFWTTYELGFDESDFFHGISSTGSTDGSIFYGVTSFDPRDQIYTQKVYRFDGDDVNTEQTINYPSDHLWWLDSLLAVDDQVYGLCVEEITPIPENGTYYHPKPVVLQNMNGTWEPLSASGLPEFGQGSIVAGEITF